MKEAADTSQVTDGRAAHLPVGLLPGPPPTSRAASEPLLRTLAPALRQIEQELRAWLDGKRRYPLTTLTRAKLEGLAIDLRRQSVALEVDQPLLTIMLMGGTGVGKSTLLNALAGGTVAQASFVRPTTRDPVVYYHESVVPERLDPALRECRTVAHARPPLAQKILVDTPDLDSNDLSNREKLLRLLPMADVVLYVGSQEKYHDRLGWQLFLEQRKRRAFAFVLNKWDRCLHGSGGVRPDDDLLRDLRSEGFEEPLLFRTCAQMHVDVAAVSGAVPEGLPPGEQFGDLVRWLEIGLTRLEIEAIKARGVSQLLEHLQLGLEAASPPDLADVALKTRSSWERLLETEAEATSEVLLNTLEPSQREIEHHFAVESQRRFRGLMAGYLHVFTRLRYLGSSLRIRLPFFTSHAEGGAPASWDLAALTSKCSELASDRHLDARGRALPNRLLVEADKLGYSLELLAEATDAAAKLDWRQRNAGALIEILHNVQRDWTAPAGIRRWVQTSVVWLSDWVPASTLLAACVLLLWDIFYRGHVPSLSQFLVPPAVLLLVLILMHVLVVLLLPLRWPAIRSEFQRRLETRLRAELEQAYAPIPGAVAEALRQERKQVEQLRRDSDQVATWLHQREQAASVAALYGH